MEHRYNKLSPLAVRLLIAGSMNGVKNGSLSQEYEISEAEDSPLKDYKSFRSTRPNDKPLISAKSPLVADKDLGSVDVENPISDPSQTNQVNKCLSHEYEISEYDDSPLKEYKSFRSTLQTDKSSISAKRPLVDEKGDGCSEVENQDPSHAKQARRCSQTTRRTVAYVCSSELIEHCNHMIKVPMRASMVHSLLEAYGLKKYMSTETPQMASQSELAAFHDQDYLEFLEKISQQDDDEKYDDEAQHFGLGYDCPAHLGVFEYTSLVCGATLKAAECLINGSCDVAINWYGGWHHGKKDGASGFCYTNDIVLGILKLREKFSRVLYVDLDLHHGDGVEDAFCTTNKVMTVSVHKYMTGFFPGTGSIKNVGYGKGKNYSVNIPLKDGIRDPEFSALVCRVLVKVKERFEPDAIVCQCGADGISGDPMESFCLTPVALGKCVHTLLSWKLPLMLLGGGGYHHANTARCWTYLTSVAVGKQLTGDIPEHKFLMEYGPDYDLSVTADNKRDENSKEYLQGVHSQILYNLNQIGS